MGQGRSCEQQLRELIDVDLQENELERLALVDALLRTAAARDRANSPHAASGDARDCERMRPSIRAALDDELAELESIRVRPHVDH